ncbi:MAG: signal peptidase I [Eubacteriales bacterium]
MQQEERIPDGQPQDVPGSTQIPAPEGEPASPISPEEGKRPDARKAVSDLFDVIELFVLCAAVILTLFTFVARPTVVRGPSMQDTLHEGDYLIVAEAGYHPSQGDIIVIQNVSLTHYGEPIVKRVIAVAGQTIDIDFATWTVTVDGIALEEPYRKVTSDRLLTSDWSYPMEIPEGYVFVMGDNRNHSADSRTAEIGLIDERCVVGKAVLRVFPFSRITLFD